MSNSEIAGILVKLKVDNSTYQSQLKKTENKTKQSAKKMANSFDTVKGAIRALVPVLAGLAITSKVIAGFQALRAEVDQVQKIGLKLGETTENISRLKFVAEQSGIGFDSLTQMLTDMSRKISEAKMNTGDAVLALQKLGLSADELQEKSPYEQFMTIAKAIPLIENASEKIYILDKLFGGAGTTLQQAFSGGYDAIEKLANSTPNVITQDTADRVAEFNDNIHRMSENIKSITLPVLSAFAKLVNKLFPDQIIKRSGMFGELDELNNKVKTLQTRLEIYEKQNRNFTGLVFSRRRKNMEKLIQNTKDEIEKTQQEAKDLMEKINELEEINTPTEIATVDMIDPFKQRLAQLNKTINLLKKEGTQETIKEIKELENVLKKLESNVFSTSEKITQYMIDSTDTWSDNLTDAILSGKDSFKSLGDFAKNILDDIGRQLLKYNITQPLVKAGVSYFSDDFTGQVKQGLNKSGQFLSNLTGINGRMEGPSLRIEQNISITSGTEVSEIDRKISQQVPAIVEAAKAGVVEASRNNPVFRR